MRNLFVCTATCASAIFASVAPVFAAGALLINEIDSDSVNTPSTDAFEFIEIFESTGASVALDGLVLVLFNGNGNRPYQVYDLDGYSTDANGYFVAGSISGTQLVIPSNTIQNGTDAVALYVGNDTDFVIGAGGTAPTKLNLVDAVVYRTGADVDGIGLDTALLDAGSIVDEFGRDGTAAAGAADSIGRLANGTGAPRNTTNWTFMPPTPGAANIPEPTGALLLGAGALGMMGRRSRLARH
jgi:hypothetical protein